MLSRIGDRAQNELKSEPSSPSTPPESRLFRVSAVSTLGHWANQSRSHHHGIRTSPAALMRSGPRSSGLMPESDLAAFAREPMLLLCQIMPCSGLPPGCCLCAVKSRSSISPPTEPVSRQPCLLCSWQGLSSSLHFPSYTSDTSRSRMGPMSLRSQRCSAFSLSRAFSVNSI